jgi:hypothetical protein
VVKERLVRGVAGLRHRRPWVDHTVRAYDRNSEVLGGQLAAAVTYYGFLSFFPLLALAFSLVGYVADVYPDAQDAVTRAVEDAFPSLIGPRQGQLDIQQVIDAKPERASSAARPGLCRAGLAGRVARRAATGRRHRRRTPRRGEEEAAGPGRPRDARHQPAGQHRGVRAWRPR